MNHLKLDVYIITLYKIIDCFIDCDTISFNFSISNQGNRIRGNSYKLDKNRIRLDARKFFFCNLVIDIWNCLSNDIVNCTTVKMFASKLKNMIYLYLLGGRLLYSFIAYCLLLHMHVFMLCHCCYANKRLELKLIRI